MSSRIPSLNLRLGDFQSTSNKTSGEEEKSKIIVRTDSELRRHKISIVITNQEVGVVEMKVGEQSLKVPTYQMRVSDDKTQEVAFYQVVRDQFKFAKKKTKKSWLSFLGITWFDKTYFLYENIAFEPSHQEIVDFQLSKYRTLKENHLIYQLDSSEHRVLLCSGDWSEMESLRNDEIDYYFFVVDDAGGRKFLGDIQYREKFLKLTPKVELQLIKRKKVTKEMERDHKGNIQRIVYL